MPSLRARSESGRTVDALKPRRVAVDFDGTLADTNALVLDLMAYRLGEQEIKPFRSARDWFFYQKSPETKKAFWDAYDLMDRTHLRRAIRPLSPLAPAVVKWLVSRGHSVDVVTANHERAVPDMRAWLFGHGLDTPVVALNRVPAEKKAELDYDLFIDDSPFLAEAIFQHAYEKKSLKRLLLIHAYYNEGVEDHNYTPHELQVYSRLDNYDPALSVLRTDWEAMMEVLRALGL